MGYNLSIVAKRPGRLENPMKQGFAHLDAGETTVLVAMDVAARGVHVDDIKLMIHVDPPDRRGRAPCGG